MQLAVTTAALAGPILLLRRHRANALHSAIPPRRAGDSAALASRFTPLAPPAPGQGQWPPPRRRGGATASFTGVRAAVPAPASAKQKDGDGEAAEGADGDEGAPAGLYAAGAFGAATLIVAVAAVATVWGVRTGLAVDNVRLASSFPFHPIRSGHILFGDAHYLYIMIAQTEEFSARMRHLVATRLSVLSARIHRRVPSPFADDVPPPADTQPADPEPENWTWAAAEARLANAMDAGGAWAWAETAVREMEAEAERARREREREKERGA